MAVSYYGTRAVSERLLPLMSHGSRIVNICSRAGQQRILSSQQLVDKFKVGGGREAGRGRGGTDPVRAMYLCSLLVLYFHLDGPCKLYVSCR